MSQLSVLLFCIVAIALVAARHVNTTDSDSDILPDGYIAGGAPTIVGQFPWIARLNITDRKNQMSYLCAGSLISERYVLSAAHCFDFNITYYSDIQIYLGEYDRNSFPNDCAGDECTKNELVFPDKLYTHSAYDSNTIANDIALLRLKKRAPLSATIQPIALPPFDLDIPFNDGATVYIAGWGTTENGFTSDVLMSTDVSLITKRKCLAINYRLPAGHFCAGDPTGRNTCKGDSGGPLVMHYENKYYLSGIVSYGLVGFECGSSPAEFFTNVYKYKQWIKIHMRKTWPSWYSQRHIVSDSRYLKTYRDI